MQHEKVYAVCTTPASAVRELREPLNDLLVENTQITRVVLRVAEKKPTGWTCAKCTMQDYGELAKLANQVCATYLEEFAACQGAEGHTLEKVFVPCTSAEYKKPVSQVRRCPYAMEMDTLAQVGTV